MFVDSSDVPANRPSSVHLRRGTYLPEYLLLSRTCISHDLSLSYLTMARVATPFRHPLDNDITKVSPMCPEAVVLLWISMLSILPSR
jgi:hypothetical protein